MDNLNFLGISGSLRRASANSGLLRAAATRLPAGVTLEIASLADIPFYNADIAEKPASVSRVLAQMAAADPRSPSSMTSPALNSWCGTRTRRRVVAAG